MASQNEPLNFAGPTLMEDRLEALDRIYKMRIKELKDHCLANIAGKPETQYAEGMSDAFNKMLRKLAAMFPDEVPSA